MSEHHETSSSANRSLGRPALAALFFALGAAAGFGVNLRETLFADSRDVEITQVLDLYGQSRSSAVSFTQYWEVWDKIKAKYVNQPVGDVDLFYGSVEGMVRSLHDPYSAYFPPQKAEEFAKDLSGEFEGIGAEIGLKEEQLIVIAPLPGSPAEKAGLRAKDKIFTINGQETYGLSLDEAVSKIRGPRGTAVKLLILRGGESETREVEITREKINVPSVTWEKKADGIAYLRVSYFNETTSQEFNKIAGEIAAFKPRGIILDLRSNPGGFLDRSILVASEWVEEGVIVRERFVNNEINEYKTSGLHRFAGVPTVVLVDEGTASGAEIVAGALQDHGVADIVGAKTFGKGSVQDFEPLPDGSALKLTIAKWLTPKNREIDGIGIDPDITVDEMFEQKPGETGTDREDYTDKGVEKAMEILQKKL